MTHACTDCGQPMLPPGEVKRPNEYDHARGCPQRPPQFARGGTVRETATWSWMHNADVSGLGFALYSSDKLHRFMLGRDWGIESLPRLMFVGLNPSTATHEVDDPTIAKLVGYARRWGLHGLDMFNLFAFRSTDPAKLPYDIERAAGLGNFSVIFDALKHAAAVCDTVAFGWGNHANKSEQRRWLAARVLRAARDLGARPKCFKMTKQGQPHHPLYLSNEATLMEIPNESSTHNSG